MGSKKSVLEWRSPNIKRSVPDKIGNVNKSMKAVIKKAQGNNGIVFNVREYNLRFRMVTQKLRDVRHEDIPEINNPKII